MDTNTFLPSKCTHMVKVITAVDYKSSNTHNTSLEGAIYEAEIAPFSS